MNRIPVIGWCLSFVAAASMAVPFWLCWTVCGVGEKYFAGLIPSQFVSIPFWDVVGLFIVAAIFRSIIPKFVSSSSSSEVKEKSAE